MSRVRICAWVGAWVRLGRWLPWIAAIASVGGQTDGAQRWAFNTLSTSVAGSIMSSPAVGADGTVYIGVEVGTSGAAAPSGRLFAISPSGAQQWVFTTPDWIDSTPAIAPDGTIYFGCWDGKFYALRSDGSLKWSYTAGGFIASSPALATDGTIYFGSGDGNLHALTPDGALKWTFPAIDWIDSSPAVAADGTIYIGSWDNNVYAIRPDGTEKWHYATSDDVTSSPAIAADGTVYVGSRDRVLYAFTPAGVLKWGFGTADQIEGSPVVAADGAIYFASTGGRLFALNADGTERWRYPRSDQPALLPIYSTPAIRADGTIIFGTSDNAIQALKPDGTLLWRTALGDYADSSPVIAADGSIYVGCYDKRLYAIAGNGQPLDPASPWPGFRRDAARGGRAQMLAISLAPLSQTATAGAAVTLTTAAVAGSGGPAPVYQWRFNGGNIGGATGTALTLADFKPAQAGLYGAFITNSASSTTTDPAIVGLATTTKIVGAGTEVLTDVFVPSVGNTFDQVLLGDAAVTVTADPGQITRLSFVDLTDDIVQVEFSGAGTLSLVLEVPTGPAAPINYNQSINYMKGHAGIVIAGANETTNVSVFSVGRITAVNQALFKGDVVYDGVADIAFIAILSADGKFGGLRTANARYLAVRGLTGLYAPGVQFKGPVFVGDITAFDAAEPVLILGAASDTRITGGDLFQANAKPVAVSGVGQLKFTDGSTSHGAIISAQLNKAKLQQNGAEVSAQIVVNPSP